MDTLQSSSRRRFLKGSALLGGGLLIGFSLPPALRGAEAATAAAPFAPNAWIRVGTDGAVTIIVDKSEMGQGVLTSLPMIAAEELKVDWSGIAYQQAPADKAYFNPMFGSQGTGGSTSVRASWMPLRKAGAAAREMLVSAAAKRWGVPAASCVARDGKVVHQASGRSLGYGELAEAAASLPVPDNPKLTDPADFRIIGQSLKRLDTPEKIDGTAEFGIDVTLPGMLTATTVHCPTFGGRWKTYNADKAKAIKGVRHVVALDTGIAVVADSFWQAKRGADALEIEWDRGSEAQLSTEDIRNTLKQAAAKSGAIARRTGDAHKALAGSAKVLEADYEVPFLAHAMMEPMNCTADVRPDGCEIWEGTQSQTAVQRTAAKLAGLDPSQVKVHTTLLGTGFGRRSEVDLTIEAVKISKAVKAPVKVLWTREQDTQHDFYRPATYNRLRAGLNARGGVEAWSHRIVGPSIMSRLFPNAVKDGLDPSSVEGAADLPYGIPNIHVDYVMQELGVPVGFWRSVGHSQNAFITECFLDEVIHAAGGDPFEMRKALLADKPRHRGVLELAASKAGWGRAPRPGRFRGIAVHKSFGSYVAQVAEVSVSDRGVVRVHRVVCAVDCGQVVNPGIVEAQIQSAIVFGLTAALYGDITFKNGAVQQSNFDTYRMLRIEHMPEVEVHIVPSRESPGGMGEPGTPPIAPAVANAVFAATGKRVRRLPIRLDKT